MNATLSFWGTLTALALLQGTALAADDAGVKKDPVAKAANTVLKEGPSGVKPASASRPVWENGLWVYTVSQTVDGNVAGRTSAFSEAGRLRPARVRVGFVQGGRIVSATASDEAGRFLVKGIAPGVYTVIAAGSEGIGVLWVRVNPYDEKAKSEAGLEVTLAATADAVLLSELISGNVDRAKQPLAKPADGQ